MYELTDPVLDQIRNLKRQKLIVLGVMLALSGIFGVLDSVYESVPGWEKTSFILDTLSFAICLSVWCSYDAALHGFRLSPGVRLAVILIALIGFPVYAFKYRGRGGWRLLGLGVLFFLLLMGVSIVAGCVTDLIMENVL